MDFRVNVAPAAADDLDQIAGYIRERGSQESSELWFNGIMTEIRTLRSSPGRCPISSISTDVGIEVRVLLFGRRHRPYKVYFIIGEETQAVSIVHIRHWARRAVSAIDLVERLREIHD